jgi:hypothetical protein
MGRVTGQVEKELGKRKGTDGMSVPFGLREISISYFQNSNWGRETVGIREIYISNVFRWM